MKLPTQQELFDMKSGRLLDVYAAWACGQIHEHAAEALLESDDGVTPFSDDWHHIWSLTIWAQKSFPGVRWSAWEMVDGVNFRWDGPGGLWAAATGDSLPEAAAKATVLLKLEALKREAT